MAKVMPTLYAGSCADAKCKVSLSKGDDIVYDRPRSAKRGVAYCIPCGRKHFPSLFADEQPLESVEPPIYETAPAPIVYPTPPPVAQFQAPVATVTPSRPMLSGVGNRFERLDLDDVVPATPVPAPVTPVYQAPVYQAPAPVVVEKPLDRDAVVKAYLATFFRYNGIKVPQSMFTDLVRAGVDVTNLVTVGDGVIPEAPVPATPSQPKVFCYCQKLPRADVQAGRVCGVCLSEKLGTV